MFNARNKPKENISEMVNELIFIDRNLNWKALKLFGKNKFVLNTSAFLFLTPLLAKLVIVVEEILKEYFGKEFAIDLPFSWQLLFFAACFFGIGTLLFRIRCPRIIYEFENFGEYLSSGRFFPQIERYIEDIAKTDFLEYANQEALRETVALTSPTQVFCYEGKSPKNLQRGSVLYDLYRTVFYRQYFEYRSISSSPNIEEERRKLEAKKKNLSSYLRDVFTNLYDLADYERTGMRYVIASCFLLGTSLVGIVMCKNIQYVIVSIMG